MMRYCALVFFLVQLFLNGQNATKHWTLLPNILVLEVNGSLSQQPLTCLETASELTGQGSDIIWKKDGVNKTQRGNSFMVQLEESLGGGDYTCHRKDGSLLNHTVVLIHEDESKPKKILLKTDQEYLKCFTQNYNGEFKCFWKWNPSRLGRVAFVRAHRGREDNDTQCSASASGQQWTCSSRVGDISCTLDAGGQGLSCLDKQHCPYAEETQHVHLTVYLRSKNFLIEEYTQLFYFSEIAKPDKVRIKRVHNTMVEWSYPSSWSTPYSYFPLTFQIKQIRGCRKLENPCTMRKKVMLVSCTDICQFTMKKRWTTVCVRARDALCNSQWSEWGFYRQEGKGQTRQREQNKG